ncbi:PKD domain-containing protein [Novosphingobium aerophilum]|uniref:PKD domain-containing protein n=1 Tax=Novosphingobium aerophilum TaxID=2839843 RepID=UPI003FCFC7B2
MILQKNAAKWAVSAVVLATFLSAAAPGSAEAPTVAAAAAGLSVQGYGDEDALFARPFIDRDEPRTNNGTAYRYVHGGFEGTDTRFSFYFPAARSWQGRFFQYITPVPDSETLSQGLTGEEDRIGAAMTSGAYFIETNGGGAKAADPMGGGDLTIGAFRANAASARFSRFVAAQVYGARKQIYGYAYGGSGGAYRTLGSLENTRGVWDGAVPYVLGSPMAIPNMFTVRLKAMRVLGEKLDGVVDALDAGGSGDPYSGLDDEQKAALREVTAMGFQPRSWYAWRTMGPHAFALLFGGIRMADASYFTDFWTKPGYEGHDSPELYKADRVQLATRVVEVISADKAKTLDIDPGHTPGTAKGTADLAWQAMGLHSAGEMPVAVRLADSSTSKALLLSDLVLASGKKVVLSDVHGDLAMLGINDPRLLATIRAGDPVRLDNSDILAVQSYHSHQVPDLAEYPVWKQFTDAQGKPLHAQRPMLLGPLFTKNAAGSVPSGKFDGKVILVENLWDREALPWQGDWYRSRVKAYAGAAADERFRIWYTDRALHGDQTRQDDPSRVVSYIGMLQQALRDLAAWVEQGKAPPASTSYHIEDGQVVTPASAAARKGIQPVITLAANGGALARIKAGTPVRLTATIEVPPGSGSVVSAEWDFEGDGTFEAPATLPAGNKAKATVSATHVYDRAGTYFAVLRAASQREGDRQTAFARIQNLARARIVVE